MDPQQYQYYTQSIQLCNKRINQLENDRDNARRCFTGDMLTAYRKSAERAIQEVKKVRSALYTAQSLQQ